MGRLEPPSQASEPCALSVELYAQEFIVNLPGYEPGTILQALGEHRDVRFHQGLMESLPESNRNSRYRRTLPCALDDRLMVGPVRFELTSLRLKGECRYPLCDEPKW